MVSKQPAVVMEEVIDPVELAEAWARRARNDRNWAWFEAHAAEIYRIYRGKCFCISGEQLFVADTPAEALALAKAAYPEDDGRFTGIIPKERLARIYKVRTKLPAHEKHFSNHLYKPIPSRIQRSTLL